jgi:hypothetical protein
LKQPGLAEFAREIKAGIMVWKDMSAMLAAHSVKGLTASLGENDGLGLANGGSIFLIWQAACTKDVLLGYDIRVKRQNHLRICPFLSLTPVE